MYNSRRVIFLFLLTYALFIALAGSMPSSVLMEQWADDALFIRLGNNISEGRWLGGYNNLTLVKGPIFPIFIGWSSFTGVPFNICELSLHFLGSLSFSYVIYRLTGSKLLFAVLFLSVLLCPGMYLSKGRILRNSFTASLFLITSSFVITALFLEKHRIKKQIYSFFSGIFVAGIWLTREESIWIVPGLLVLFGFYILNEKTQSFRNKMTLGLMVVASFSIGFATVFFSVATLNFMNYGRFVTVEMKDGPMQDAMSALHRVGAVHSVPYVPVPNSAREDIARESPAFRSVVRYFRRDAGPLVCKMLPTSCGDIAGGWFIWTFRDAAKRAGAHSSANTAAKFYASVAREVNEACDAGRLRCVAWMPPLIPPIPAQQWRRVPELLWRSFGLAIYVKAPRTFRRAPSGLKPDGEMALRLLNHPVIFDEAGNVKASRLSVISLKIWHRIVRIMTGVSGYLNLVGLFSTVLLLIFMKFYYMNPVFSLMLYLYIGAAAQLFILILVHISSFPTIYYPRFPVIHTLIGAASVLSLYLLVDGAHRVVARSLYRQRVERCRG